MSEKRRGHGEAARMCWDALTDESTAPDIARATGLNVSYVRAWSYRNGVALKRVRLDERYERRRAEEKFCAGYDVGTAVADGVTLPDLVGALKDVCTQYRLIHGEPVPGWIRNAYNVVTRCRRI